MQGLILLNKPAGITSFGAVAALKKLVGEKRAGHTGTLDPMATGVLPVLFGRATCLSGLMLDADKTYIATLKLGVTTDTDDITGAVIQEKPVTVTTRQIEEVLTRFTGAILQRPPIYSALKKDGVRLYKYARAGERIELSARKVTVYSLTLLTSLYEPSMFEIEARVSKGTYIRSLARDIGEALGCGACLSALCRTAVSGFHLQNCVSLDDLTKETIGKSIIGEETAVAHLRAVTVTEKQAVRFCNGGQLSFERLNLPEPQKNELFRVKYGSKLIGIGRADLIKKELAIRCLLNQP